MGRRPRGVLKDEPYFSDKITANQADLLGWVYIEGFEGETSRIQWSPQGYAERALTNAETATLTKRVKTLVERGLLTRKRRDIILTTVGREALRKFISTRKELAPELRAVELRLEIDEMLIQVRAVNRVLDTLEEFKGTMPNDHGEFDVTYKNVLRLGDLLDSYAMKKLDEFKSLQKIE